VSAATTTASGGRPGPPPPPDAIAPARHPGAPAPGELLGALDDHPHGPRPAARGTAVAGRTRYAAAKGLTGRPDGPAAVRADALFVEAGVDRFTGDGRPEGIRAAMSGPGQVRVARAFEVNP
jgi:hypothetical protein